jgi:hypothetical protein
VLNFPTFSAVRVVFPAVIRIDNLILRTPGGTVCGFDSSRSVAAWSTHLRGVRIVLVTDSGVVSMNYVGACSDRTATQYYEP